MQNLVDVPMKCLDLVIVYKMMYVHLAVHHYTYEPTNIKNYRLLFQRTSQKLYLVVAELLLQLHGLGSLLPQ